MAERFAGQTAIITGANREIRLATPERLVTEGAKVVITGRKPDALTAAVAALGGAALKVARSVVEVNVLSALSWLQKTDTAWMRRHGGAIANVASLGGIRPDAGVAVHGVSKALALELTPLPSGSTRARQPW
jgi:3-oxoacyl-[acyl-carrier protein] reductase